MREIGENSVDSIVTDPPAGISFMGKAWDGDKGGRDEWIAWLESVMRECYRVMKPGAHGFVWALPRTSHWTGTAIENAGFQVRDICTHLFGSGFPKSLDVSKAIDKAAGAAREDLGPNPARIGRTQDIRGGNLIGNKKTNVEDVCRITAPSTDAAKQWQGWGTALKPASEHWILIRKPLSEKTIAANVLKWGTGGINIDGCRIPMQEGDKKGEGGDLCNAKVNSNSSFNLNNGKFNRNMQAQGRFPSNLLLDETAAEMLDAQSGIIKKGGLQRGSTKKGKGTGGERTGHKHGVFGPSITEHIPEMYSGDYGASRFFYIAKASKRERNEGLEGMPEKECGTMDGGHIVSEGRNAPKTGRVLAANHHPTVKSITLMRYLCRLITPPNGKILDPFCGSGSTGVAALKEGFRFIGIEREAEYVEIARKRLAHTK